MRSIIPILLLTAATTLADLPPTAETHQVLYLADSGVIALQMSVIVDGQGPKQRFEAVVDSLLKSLDKNADGVVTTDEARGKILTVREAQQMQLTTADGVPADSSPDSNPKDGKISRGELLAYFKRIGLLPFAVKLQPRTPPADGNQVADPNRSGEVSLFAKLDVDNDKKLSVSELQNALEVLHKLDRDDDDTISVAELQPLANQPRNANRQAMNNAPVSVMPFVSLDAGESVPKLIRRLIDKYDSADAAKSGVPSLSSRNQKLSRMELGLPDGKFDQYDVDGDGQLDSTELRQFVSSPEAGLSMAIDITAGKVEQMGPADPNVVATPDGALNLQFGTAQITLTVSPTTLSVDTESMIRPLLTAFDADANGYLEKGELPDNALMGASFADLDADKNGKLFLEELTDYLRPRLVLAQNRVELTIIEQGRTLFDILDSDRDGRLSHREVRSVADKLVLWDRNGDGALSETEIPLQYRIVATNGDLAMFGRPQINSPGNQQGPGTARPNGPAWFLKMDRNRDGEVSRREFLGELELFDSLDRNHDGALELIEAMQVRGQ